MKQAHTPSLDTVVIGAGIVGVSTALWLQRAGQRVLLIDRDRPAAGTSFGNAGVVASGSVVPVTIPGLIRKVPKMLLSPNQPLFLRWTYLPRLLPFLATYLQHSNDAAVTRISHALFQLLNDALAQHHALAADTPAAGYLSDEPFVFAYPDKAAFDQDGYTWAVRKQRGVAFDTLDAEALAAFDPVLRGKFGYGVRILDNGKVADPGAYVQALVDHFLANGGRFKAARLGTFDIRDAHCHGIETNHGKITAEHYVLATGIQSGELAKTLGIQVPLESERGYHVEYHQPSLHFRSPVMVAEEKFVATSMDGRLRCAGVIEFGGPSTTASSAPLELIKNRVAKVFPELRYAETTEWLGHRPATPDSLPVIGHAPQAANVLVGYGHQHIGLSSGPKTGRWLAALAAGETITDDLSVYAPDRRITG